MKNFYSYENIKVLSDKQVEHYVLPYFPNKYEKMQIKNIDVHTWSKGDRLIYLSEKYYKNPSFWWVIAWYNGVVFEQNINEGEQIFIPLILEDVLELFKKIMFK